MVDKNELRKGIHEIISWATNNYSQAIYEAQFHMLPRVEDAATNKIMKLLEECLNGNSTGGRKKD
jgi:hypothetical protein